MTTLASPPTPALLDADAQRALFVAPRTARAFTDEPVGDDVVAAAYELARWSPTAFNSSPLRLLAVRSQEARARLVAHIAPANRDRVLAAPLALVVAADTDFHHHLDRLAPAMDAARFDADPVSRERLARDNTWLQAGYLMTALRSAGWGVGPMTGLDAAGVDGDLLAGTSLRTVMVVLVGRPADDPDAGRAERLPADDVLRTV